VSHPAIHPERPRIAVPCGCTLGEGPIWDDRSGTLFWVDIKAPAVWRWKPDGSEQAVAIPVAEQVGFIKLTANEGRVIVGLRTGIALLDLDSGETRHLVRPEPEQPGNRLNDGTVGPDGTLYFGTMDDAEVAPIGRFYHWSQRGLHAFGEPTLVPNGPAIDGPAGLLYAARSAERRVDRHRLGPDGAPGPAETFCVFDEGAGHPDGLSVDAEGHVWIAHWAGSRVTRYTPDGEAVLVVTVPTALVTKVAFGGPDLATMFITSAAIGRDPTIDLHAGHVFAIETGIRGRPAEICRMGGDLEADRP
jgi:sugar lactone lactonase YvrE